MTTAAKLVINLQAIADNWRTLNQKIGDSTVCGAVVKANAYGLGIQQVASVLHASGCRLFFVATLHEGRLLRQSLPHENVDIVVFGGLVHDIDGDGESCAADWKSYRLIPTLFSVNHIHRWYRFCQSDNQLPYALKIDTGMHRLGVSPQELQLLISDEMFKQHPPVHLMSHLACADTPQHPLNQEQLRLFIDCAERVKSSFPQVVASLANSSGIFLNDIIDFPYFDAVRPGCSLYGINPVPYQKNPMRQVVSLQLPVMQIKTINAGESVGYGAEFIAREKMVIAIIFGGYADGVFRYLGERGRVFYQGVCLPMIGRVSMDSFAVNIQELPEKQRESLHEVELIGEYQSVDVLAEQAGTIAYEVLTNLGQRFQRCYIGVSQANAEIGAVE